MTRQDLQYRIEAAIAAAGIALLRRLPPAWASSLAGTVTRTIGPLLPVTRVGDANLRLALPDLDASQRRRILRDAWENLGRTVAELPHVASLAHTPSGLGWEVVGGDILEAAARAGGPAIFVSGHLANWEILPATAAHYGMPMSSFYRAPSNPYVDHMLADLRSASMPPGTPNFAKGAQGARAAMQHLSKRGYLGMLADQKMNDGIPAPLFGYVAMTPAAAAAFALRYRCPVIPAHSERLGPAQLRVVIEPPMDLPDTGNRARDIATLTAAINARIEAWVRARPGEWLWLHRRWPKQPQRWTDDASEPSGS